MATLTETEKTQIRRAAAKKARELGVPVSWVKDQIHGACQAVEDILSGSTLQTQINTAIETAAPGVFSTAEKRWLAALAMELKYCRDILG